MNEGEADFYIFNILQTQPEYFNLKTISVVQEPTVFCGIGTSLFNHLLLLQGGISFIPPPLHFFPSHNSILIQLNLLFLI